VEEVRVLITGVAGFLGSFLAERLVEEGYKVIGIDNLSRGKMENIQHIEGLKFVKDDVLNISHPEVFKNVDIVFHYAAINGTKNFYDFPAKTLATNTEGIINVLKLSIKYGVKKFIFSSSSEVYGEPLKVPTSEDTPILVKDITNPRSSYDVSKIVGEAYTIFLCKKAGMDYIIQRIFNVYGPKMDTSEYGQVIPEFIRKILKEDKFTIIGPGTQTRSFCYIDDFVEMTIRLLEHRNVIVNVGNPEEIKIIDLARLLHEIAGKEFEYKLLPPRRGDIMRRVPDISKLIKLTGYRPRISLKEGLKRTFRWYQSRLQ